MVTALKCFKRNKIAANEMQKKHILLLLLYLCHKHQTVSLTASWDHLLILYTVYAVPSP